jgi:coproporphyrinogen III oxidase
MSLIDQAADFFRQQQDRICAALESIEFRDGRTGRRFHEDSWDYSGRGGGRTRVLSEGSAFEKAGVNYSDVSGEFSADFAADLPGDGRSFRATGVSLVLHPWNPYVPTVHANFRAIQRGSALWFGGGADLTPYYPFQEDVVHFHRVWRDVCRRYQDVVDYRRLKTWCDEYFFIKHRNEHRGVGGIFFDYLKPTLTPQSTEFVKSGDDRVFDFVKAAAESFLDAYTPIANRRIDLSFGDRERDFQLVRRGRYVEFNLIYDRGTTFGLKTGGRIESILMSLPLNVKWVYDHRFEPGSPESKIFEYLKPRDWADETIDS